jgi:hypothetical protein
MRPLCCVATTLRRLLRAPALLAAVFAATAPLARAGWPAVAPADLAATESTSCPGADAEILLSEHELSETSTETRTEDYVRAKVYTRKGVDEQGKFSIEYSDPFRVRPPSARVVKPDGTSIELKKSDIFETVVAKVGQEKRTKISFAFPNLEPGDIVEYRWVTYRTGNFFAQWVLAQDKLPVREYHFMVRSMQNPGSVAWMNCPNAKSSGGMTSLEMTAHNLPAFDEEENMPPEREFRGWIFVIRTFPGFNSKDMWQSISSYWADEFEVATRPGGFFKTKAVELTAGATGDDEKLRRLYEFCQEEITNYSWVSSPEIQAAREKSAKEPAQAPKRVVERRAGWLEEINRVFAALARGAGYKVREARSASKTALLGVRGPSGWAFLDRTCVAVEVGGQWRYFDPGSYFVPFGMLGWRDDGVTMLRCDDKVALDTSPASSIDRTQLVRKGRFALDAEGTLEGEAEESFTGHLAVAIKGDNWENSTEDVDKEFRERLTKRIPTAEITDIVWTNLRTRQLPLTVKYHVRVPGFAEQAGKRLVFAPAFFEAGEPVVFAADVRKFPIMFPYVWGEHDEIEITLPEGYALDQPSAPAPVGEVSSAFGAAYALKFNPKTRVFGYRRDFALGANGASAFRTESYPLLKDLFAALHKSDTHSIMLKPKEVAASAPAPAAVQP